MQCVLLQHGDHPSINSFVSLIMTNMPTLYVCMYVCICAYFKHIYTHGRSTEIYFHSFAIETRFSLKIFHIEFAFNARICLYRVIQPISIPNACIFLTFAHTYSVKAEAMLCMVSLCGAGEATNQIIQYLLHYDILSGITTEIEVCESECIDRLIN